MDLVNYFVFFCVFLVHYFIPPKDNSSVLAPKQPWTGLMPSAKEQLFLLSPNDEFFLGLRMGNTMWDLSPHFPHWTSCEWWRL